MNFYDHDIGIIAEQIKLVQILRLGPGVHSMFQFQRFCNLQTLFIDDLKTNVNESFWNQKLPELRILSVNGSGHSHIGLKQFFKNNKQLKLFHADTLTCLPALLSTEDSLPIVSFSTNDIVFDQSWANFKEFCDREMIPFVDLEIMSITNTSLRKALQSTKVKILHFTIDVQLSFNQDINLQSHIEQLCLKFDIPLSMVELSTIFSCFPNLSVIRLRGNKLNNISHQDVMAALVKNLPKMKDIYYSDRLEFDPQEWDRLRSNPKNNSIVTIHLDDTAKRFAGCGIEIYSLQGTSAAVKFEETFGCPKCGGAQSTDARSEYLNGLISN